MATNVKPEDLNYDHYETEKYDADIMLSIPGHNDLHAEINKIVERDFKDEKAVKILDLGVGTGLTVAIILRQLPNAEYIVVDFSKQMLAGARKRLVGYNVTFVEGDYSKIELPGNNNLVVSVIGIHHQETDDDKRLIFQKIYGSLKKNGSFIFGDLVTYKDPVEIALNEARHFHHLVENAQDEKSLREWAHHHKYLNSLAPLEDQVKWLKEVGFREVEILFLKFNTALIYAQK
jgi:tRNA (cmo5U34)-methyltransferase